MRLGTDTPLGGRHGEIATRIAVGLFIIAAIVGPPAASWISGWAIVAMIVSLVLMLVSEVRNRRLLDELGGSATPED